MKKITFCLAILLVGLGMSIYSTSAHAASTLSTVSPEEAAALQTELNTLEDMLLELQSQTAPQGVAVIVNQEDAKILKQSLDVLSVTLTTLQSQLVAKGQPSLNISLISANLGNITRNLVAIQSTLINPKQNSQNPSIAAITPTPATPTFTENLPIENVANENMVAMTEEGVENSASMESALNPQRVSVPTIVGIAAIVILGIATMLSRGRAKDEKTETSQTKAYTPQLTRIVQPPQIKIQTAQTPSVRPVPPVRPPQPVQPYLSRNTDTQRKSA
ncbi:hypothetical protein HY967_03130 [Candidatus Jorgensenbacteria bacterium]|nr:hypothetical protein [Candidatus Jorgensenbacteria bacterium]